MGMSYGASGRSQGLTSAETKERNASINKINSSKNPVATGRAEAKRFKQATGKNLWNYIEEPKPKKKKK